MCFRCKQNEKNYEKYTHGPKANEIIFDWIKKRLSFNQQKGVCMNMC